MTFPPIRLRLAVLLIAVQPFAAQEPARVPSGAPAPFEACAVEGMVVKATTGEPLKRARITLRRAEGREPPVTAVTDAAGRFSLQSLAPGRYRLTVERNGHVRQEYGQRLPGRPGTILTLNPGQVLRDLSFRMVPSATLTGRVFDEEGEPMPMVNVQALRYSYAQGRRQLVTAGGGNTNDLGEFRIWGLAPGRYYLSATLSPGVAFVGGATVPGGPAQPEEGYAPTYFPGTNDPARASAIELRAGEEVRQMDLTMQQSRTVRVRGTILNAVTGQPGRGAQVMLMARESGARTFFVRSNAVVEGAEGSFELRGVVPGSYYILALWFDGDKAYSARGTVEVGSADVDGVSLIISPGVDIPGRVTVEGGELLKADLRLALAPRDEGVTFGASGSTVKADGTFRFANVGEGAFNVQVFPLPEGYYLKAVRVGAEDVLVPGLTVTRAALAAPLEIVLSAAGGRVEGIVLTEEQLPAHGTFVALVPRRELRGLPQFFRTTTTDQFGRFALRGVAPGEYRVFAWEEMEPGAHLDPEFLSAYEEKGVKLDVKEAAQHQVELKLIPARPGG
jgi:5-hydroxyisourate hydrolase-like protein (transthyretin family)